MGGYSRTGFAIVGQQFESGIIMVVILEAHSSPFFKALRMLDQDPGIQSSDLRP